MKSKTARSLRRPLCNHGLGHETRHQQRHTQAAMLLLSYRVIYTHSPPHPPLLSTSSLYYHPLSWTPLSLHIHTSCPPPPYTTTHSAGHPTPFTVTPPVHFLPIQSPSQLDTPLSSHSHLTVHLPPIQPPTQLDTMSSYFPTSLSPHQVPQRPPNRSLNAQLVAPGAPSMVRNGHLRLILISSSKPQLVTSSPAPLQRLSHATRS